MMAVKIVLLVITIWAASAANAVAAPVAADPATTRIVSLVPNLTEIAFTLGAGNQVVGVSDFCQYPPEAKQRPAVGGLVNPSLEGVLRLRPGVVLLYRSQQDFANRLGQLGIPSELFQVDTLADLYAAIDRMGKVTGYTSAAVELTGQIQRDLNEVTERADTKPAVTGIVVVSRDPAGLRSMYQAAAGNFLGELFQIAGGKLAVPGGAAISAEDIIRANPRVIIDMSPTEGSASAAADALPRVQQEVRQWSRLSTVPAVRTGQVYHWSDPHSLLLGPSIIDTVRQMERILNTSREIPFPNN